jgi:chorismate dehydratase
LKIAQISYLNTALYFSNWDQNLFPLSPGVPRMLAQAASQNQLIAGPLPLVECWNLEEHFSNLGHWGIASRERSQSVLVFSKKPFSRLNDITLGLTQESSTSVVLCSILLEQKYGHSVQMKRGLSKNDDAWLVIGDEALNLSQKGDNAWPFVTDLGTEWWDWKKLPFVFARWVVQRNISQEIKTNLIHHVAESFHKSVSQLNSISGEQAVKYSLEKSFVENYLRNFMYELDDTAIKGAEVFRSLVQEKSPTLALVV